MDDYPELPTLPPKEALGIISSSPLSRAQKLLSASLVTQAKVVPHRYPAGRVLLYLDVKHFLNHRVNTKLIGAIGEELAAATSLFTPDLVFTAPASGNFLALATATFLPGIPDVIYAPKGLPWNRKDSYAAQSHSYPHRKQVSLTVAKDILAEGSKVAVCDDFLDTGRTIATLMDIVTQAAARTVTAFFAIEKPFGGRQELINLGIPDEAIVSLVKIDSMRPGKIKLAGFDYWFRDSANQ